VILFAVLAGVTLPITPLQILWINMTTAVLLGLALAFEPIQRDVMARPPRAPGTPILDGVLIRRIVLVGLLLLVAAFGLFLRWRAWVRRWRRRARWRSMCSSPARSPISSTAATCAGRSGAAAGGRTRGSGAGSARWCCCRPCSPTCP
jgi:hypothetical protein